MTNMEAFLKTGPMNLALIQYGIDHPLFRRIEEWRQLSLRLGGILPRINLLNHAAQVDAQLESDILALEREITAFVKADE